MTFPIASKARAAIRQAIGYNLDAIIVSVATKTGDVESLFDTYGMARGGDDEYKGRQIIIVTATEDIAGEKSFVSSFSTVDKDATLYPWLTAATTKADTYEMWEGYTVEDVNNKINQAIVSATDDILQDKEDHSLYKLENVFEYTIPTGFKAIHTVEYEYSVGITHTLDDCEDVWTAGSNVVATADPTFEKVGNACAKFVVDGDAASGATLCYEDISSVDISDCDKIEFWMYSSVAVDASELQFMLGATAGIASPLETIDIPAMTAATWYKHCLTLANPHSDTAIISIGVRQASEEDVGAFTFYIDDVNAIKEDSRVFRPLSPDYWGIVQATTSKLQLSEIGYSKITNTRMLRLNGYQVPAELSDDITDCTIDPDYVIAQATAYLLMGKARSREVDPEDRYRRATFWMGIAETRKRQARTALAMNTRWVS